jgi:hypothetical protein
VKKTLNKKELPSIDLDAGHYVEAKRLGMSYTDYLAKLERDKGYEPVGAAAELDAFERQLAAHDIIVRGNASLVDAFYATKQSSVLFPEYISRQVSLGMTWGKWAVALEDVIAATDTLTGTAVAQIPALDFDKEKTKASKVAEGASFPTATITFKDRSIKLGKVGVKFGATYEVLRRMKLPVLNIFLQRIGYQIKKQKTELALLVLKDGDGNAGSAAATSNAGGTWTYAQYVKFVLSAEEGHEFTHVCMNGSFLQDMLTDTTNFPQFQSRGILERFLETGELVDFLGVKWTTHGKMDSETMMAWEKFTSLIAYSEAGANLVETEKVIGQQLENSVISEMIAYGKSFNGTASYKTKS